MRRRDLLAGSGVALAAGLAGCLASVIPSDGPRELDVRTPAPDDCEPDPSLRPSPDSPRARDYPALPGAPDAASAESFARAHERAYRYNSRLPEYGSIQVDLAVPGDAVVPADDGFLVGLDGRFQFDEPSTPAGTATAQPAGHRSYSAWYYVTGRFARRGAESNDPLDARAVPEALEGPVVACAGG